MKNKEDGKERNLQQTCNQLTTDCISRRDAVSKFSDLLMLDLKGQRIPTWEEVYNAMQDLPSAEPDKRLEKIADLVDGTIDHFDRDDAIDLLYQIKEVLDER